VHSARHEGWFLFDRQACILFVAVICPNFCVILAIPSCLCLLIVQMQSQPHQLFFSTASTFYTHTFVHTHSYTHTRTHKRTHTRTHTKHRQLSISVVERIRHPDVYSKDFAIRNKTVGVLLYVAPPAYLWLIAYFLVGPFCPSHRVITLFLYSGSHLVVTAHQVAGKPWLRVLSPTR
jgi:hypothetical protein